MTGPDFVVAGAMRAGTTALAEVLAGHPDVFMTTPKEPNYFATLLGAADYTGPGDQWFARQNATTAEAYEALFADGAGRALRGEASAMYVHLPGTAHLLAERYPQVRVILVLRDPAARAHSAWLYLRSKGRETEPSFARALDLEEQRRAAGYNPMWWYEGASRYAAGVRAYQDALGPDRVHVVLSEDLRERREPTLASVYRFLDVRPGPSAALDREVNASGVLIGERLSRRLLYPPDGVRRALRRVAPEPARQAARRLRQRATRRPPALEPADRARLVDRLSSEVSEVERLTGRSLQSWRG